METIKKEWKSFVANFDFSEDGIKRNAYALLVCIPDGGGAAAEVKGLWTSTRRLSSVENAFKHWVDHGAEFPEFANAKQYVEGVREFFEHPAEGTLSHIRGNGDLLYYHPSSNTFGAMNRFGLPKTMFRPIEGMDYWLRQIR
ncbi:MAG: hypothetical protein PVI75_02780 [Gammaproteobacteria bacterium]